MLSGRNRTIAAASTLVVCLTACGSVRVSEGSASTTVPAVVAVTTTSTAGSSAGRQASTTTAVVETPMAGDLLPAFPRLLLRGSDLEVSVLPTCLGIAGASAECNLASLDILVRQPDGVERVPFRRDPRRGFSAHVAAPTAGSRWLDFAVEGHGPDGYLALRD